LNAEAKVGVDYLDSTTEQNSQITAGSVELNSTGDAQLAGARIDAGKVSGTVAGNLSVESRQDHQTTAKADLDLGLTGKKAAPVDQDKLAENAGLKGLDYKPTLKFDGAYAYKDSVGQASGISGSQGVNLQVGGNTQLTGARIVSAEGRVDLGDSRVSTTTLSHQDYSVKAGLVLPHKPATEGGKPEVSFPGGDSIKVGPVTLGGRFDSQSLQSGIDEDAS
jgi:hemolysin